MSRTHKDRHRWKAKERRRSGEKDPVKIALHRKRFLERLEEDALAQNGYRPVVFQARLTFRPDEGTTSFCIHGEMVDELPFLVDEPEHCHYLIAAHEPQFNVTAESEVLALHVNRVRFLDQPCHLMVVDGTQHLCSSALACPHRRWIIAEGQAVCTL